MSVLSLIRVFVVVGLNTRELGAYFACRSKPNLQVFPASLSSYLAKPPSQKFPSQGLGCPSPRGSFLYNPDILVHLFFFSVFCSFSSLLVLMPYLSFSSHPTLADLFPHGDFLSEVLEDNELHQQQLPNKLEFNIILSGLNWLIPLASVE